MDPLSITVSVITLTEAVRRIIDLYKRVCSSLAITEEIDGLLSTVTLLGHALGLISSNLPSLPQESVTLLLPTIRECHAVLECMDELIQGCEASRPKSQPSLKLRSRMYWIKRADKIQKLKDRLNGHIFGLAFFFVIFDKFTPVNADSLNDIDSHNYQNIQSLSEDVVGEPYPQHDHLEDSLRLTQVRSDFIDKSSSLSTSRMVVHRENPGVTKACDNWQTCSYLPETSVLISLGSRSTGCFLFTYTRTKRKHWRDIVTSSSQSRRFKLSLTFYGPRWLSNASFALHIAVGGRIYMTLSCPRILLPDHAFFRAIRNGDCDQMRNLLESREASPADISLPNGLTALNIAMYHGQWEAAELLISQGATPFLSPNNYWIVQDVWDYIAYTSLIDVCVPHFTITYEALCMTASNWHLELLRICQNLGQSEALNFTRVHRSVTKWSSELLDGIENLRDQVDDTDSFGRTPLYWAATLGSAETLETLLLNGANPQLSDFNGSTPLHRAASTGCITSIKYLLRSGAEIDARDRHGFTPLTYACAQGQAEAIDFFLQHGVSIDSTNYVGETPIYMATHAKRPEVVQLLAERGASLEWSDKWGYDPLLDAVVLDSHEALTYLLSLNHRPDVRIFDGKNIFHIAALNSNFETVEILLRANITNVDPNALDDAGFRPLQYLRKRPGAEHLLEPFCALLLQADKSYPYGLDRIDEQDNIFFDAKEVQ